MGAGNQWFRLYAEFAFDPKVQMMSEALQRRFVMLLCLRCGNGDEMLHPLQDDEIAFQMRIGESEWHETKSVFIAKGFIDECNNILNWNQRQFVSDSSAERVRRHRERKKQGKIADKLGNVTVTPPEAEADTETDTEKSSSSSKQSTDLCEDDSATRPQRGSARPDPTRPLPPLSEPSDQTKRIGYVCRLLRSKGVSCNPSQFAGKYAGLENHTDDDFHLAVQSLQDRGEKRIGIGLVAAVLGDIVAGRSGRPKRQVMPESKPWFLGSSGIEAKAKELGYIPPKDVPLGIWKVDLMRLAGVTEQQYRAALADYG